MVVALDFLSSLILLIIFFELACIIGIAVEVDVTSRPWRLLDQSPEPSGSKYQAQHSSSQAVGSSDCHPGKAGYLTPVASSSRPT